MEELKAHLSTSDQKCKSATSFSVYINLLFTTILVGKVCACIFDVSLAKGMCLNY